MNILDSITYIVLITTVVVTSVILIVIISSGIREILENRKAKRRLNKIRRDTYCRPPRNVIFKLSTKTNKKEW